MLSKKFSIVSFIAAMLVAFGCAKGSDPASDNSLGNTKLAISMADGSIIRTVHWVISQEGVTQKEGIINVESGSAEISTYISGVEPGAYVMTLTADLLGPDGTSIIGSCEQSADFSVTAGVVTYLDMTLNCTKFETEGDVAVNADANLCPTIDYVTVEPLVQAYQNDIALGSMSSDGDGDAVVIAWTASVGTVNDAEQATASYTCNTLGNVDITLTVTDNKMKADDNIMCVATKTIQVTCLADVVCGDGTREDPEQCDDGNTVSNDGCSANCRDEICGDSIIQNDGVNMFETCDPPNWQQGGTCGDDCRTIGCGDGNVSGAEFCDDGNTDACSGTCAADCSRLGPVCGDGIQECDEACDDGNQIAGDGCEPDCTLTPDPCDTCSQANCSDYQGRNMYWDCFDPAVSTSAACVALVQCAHSTGCVLEDPDGNLWTDPHPRKCFCGTATQSQCMLPGAANGECKAEAEVAAETTDPMVLGERFLNTNYALGDASTLLLCERNFCADICL